VLRNHFFISIAEYDSQTDQFQMSGFGQENPIWVDPFYNFGDSTYVLLVFLGVADPGNGFD
jgi:hypothetical protein